MFGYVVGKTIYRHSGWADELPRALKAANLSVNAACVSVSVSVCDKLLIPFT